MRIIIVATPPHSLTSTQLKGAMLARRSPFLRAGEYSWVPGAVTYPNIQANIELKTMHKLTNYKKMNDDLQKIA